VSPTNRKFQIFIFGSKELKLFEFLSRLNFIRLILRKNFNRLEYFSKELMPEKYENDDIISM